MGMDEPTDFQEVVERSYRAQWGGRRFYTVTAILLLIIAIASAVALPLVRKWQVLNEGALQPIEITLIITTFACLIVTVMSALEAVRRWQREQGLLPDRAIHSALVLSMVTMVGLAFVLFLYILPWENSAIDEKLRQTIRFLAVLVCGLVWLASVVMGSAAITMLITRRNDLLEVTTAKEGTAVLFRKGQGFDIVKLTTAIIIPLIIFVTVLLLASAYLI